MAILRFYICYITFNVKIDVNSIAFIAHKNNVSTILGSKICDINHSYIFLHFIELAAYMAMYIVYSKRNN